MPRENGTDPTSTDQQISSDTQTELNRIFEANPIIEVFDKPSNLRILITLIDAAGMPLTVTDITNQAGIKKQSFYNNEDLLLDYELIEKADKIGNAQRYKVDMSNDVIQALMQLYDELIDAANTET